MGYPMPDLSQNSGGGVKPEQLVKGRHSLVHGQSSESSPGKLTAQGTPEEGIASPVTVGDSPSADGGDGSDDSSRYTARDSVGLIRDASGRKHYIGPSGSLAFFAQLRMLLKSPEAVSAASLIDTSKFSHDDTAQALEASEQPVGGAGEGLSSFRLGPMDMSSPASVNSSIARDFASLAGHDTTEFLQLPPQELLNSLIDAYFKNVHDEYPLFHRATFEDEYETFVASIQQHRGHQFPDPTSPDWGWIGCLHMIIVFGSISTPKIPKVDHIALRRRSVAVVRNLLPQFISKSSLANVRVLLLLALFLHNNNERNAAWNIVGTATRMAFALGLHRSDMTASFRPIERELRKRVFCTLYGFEQFLSSSLGRPSGLHEFDVEVVPPREGILDAGNSSAAQLARFSLKLQRILGQARRIHSSKVVSQYHVAPDTGERSIEGVLAEVRRWKEELSNNQSLNIPPIKISPNDASDAIGLDELRNRLSWQTVSHLRSVLLLNIQYHYIVILVTRSILLREIAATMQGNHPQPSTRSSTSALADKCLKHACQLAAIVLLLDSFDLVNGLLGLDVFYAYSAAMVLNLRLLGPPSPRNLASPQEDATQKTIARLYQKLQGALRKVDKCGTMKRLARVMETFAECAKNAQFLGKEPLNSEMPFLYNNEQAAEGSTPWPRHANSMSDPNTEIPPTSLGQQYAPLLAYMHHSTGGRHILPGLNDSVLNLQTEPWQVPGSHPPSTDPNTPATAAWSDGMESGELNMLDWQDVETFLVNYNPQQ
jgi:hypothetical protein